MLEKAGEIVQEIRQRIHPIAWDEGDYDPLIELVGDRRIVLLGEATHGTHEFYRERSRITQRLIEEKGFTTIAVEADWPDAYRINRYIRGTGDDGDAHAALGNFCRFPLWMWRNAEVADLITWLRARNDGRPAGSPAVGFYGLDLYSLFTSMAAVLEYLDAVDPEGARRARDRYACFEDFGEDSQAYGYSAGIGISESCEREAVQQLVDLRRRAGELASRDGRVPEDEYFYAEQNARLVMNAEAYYRAIFRGRTASWNMRDRHMAETLGLLIEHFESKGQTTRVVVWAHNSHLGDARATEMGQRGELNLGQLVREEFGDQALLVGFTTALGSVTAADDWDAPARRKRIRTPLPESYEHLFHHLDAANFLLPLRRPGGIADALLEPRLERAIGVIYRPETERVSHYFRAQLPEQFDAAIHFDETSALEPIDREPGWAEPDAPETYPFNV